MVIWSYLVLVQGPPGWVVAGDSSLSFDDQLPLADVLNAAGEKGWELTAGLPASSGGTTLVFKRPVDIGEEAENAG
jgi:hypothetical protein